MADDLTQQIEAHLRMLVATGLDCSHPSEFRRPPPFPSDDPREWECGVCRTVQMAQDREAARRLEEALGG